MRSSFQVERAHRFDGVGDLLSVSADVLDGRAPDASGNAAQALDSGAILHDGLRDKVIPIDTCSHAEEHGVARRVVGTWASDAADCDLQHQTRPTRIGDHEIASSAQDKQRQIAGFRELRGLADLVFSF